MNVFKFICRHCGPSEKPCDHALDLIELMFLREMQEKQDRRFALVEAQLLEIIHILNSFQSATLTLQILSGGTSMPKTVAPGGTASALFQEWTGPNGTGTVVPNAGVVAFTSDNPAVATVDPASGAVVAIAAGTANISGTDPANGLTASDVLTVSTPVQPAVSATLVLQ